MSAKKDRGPCAVDGCGKPARNRGWCSAHYERWRRNGDPGPPGDARRRPPRACAVDECESQAARLGWCDMHHGRWQRHGDPRKTVRNYGAKRNVTVSGYVRVWEPMHPLAMSDGYVAEHRKVVHDAGIEVPPGHEVHHINEDRADNRIENLELLPAGVHQSRHNQERGWVRNQHGKWPLRERVR